LTGLICHNEGVFHFKIDNFHYAMGFEMAINYTEKLKNKEGFQWVE